MFKSPQIKAKVIEDSISGYEDEIRLTTLELEYPRFIHSEFMTHRAFSRNAASSRAIPVAKIVSQVRNNPATPIHWGANRPGMQAQDELTGETKSAVIDLWFAAADAAADIAEKMQSLGLHKQVANRILEPFQIMRTIVTATEWDNFFELRLHPDAEPNIQALAFAMKEAMGASVPVYREEVTTDKTDMTRWHLPYVSSEEREQFADNSTLLVKMSVARCARVSYLTHDNKAPDMQADCDLHDRLVGSVPRHASPAEHQAYYNEDHYAGAYSNFFGWVQYRKILENS